MKRWDWKDYRASEYADIDPMRTIAILPTAAIEQHGPHLPVGTDTIISEGMQALLKATCPPDMDLRFLPTQAVGKSNEHLWARGTLTLTAQTALSAWTEIGLSVARAGVKKLVILNSHGGNVDLISIVGRELRVRAGMLVVKLGWGAYGTPEGMYSAQESSFGIHGGDVETSLLLAFRPETVDMGLARDFRSTAETAPISPIGGVSYGWIASDLNPAGVVGEAHLATAEKGHATAAKMVADVITLLHKVEAHPLEGFDPVPLAF